MKTCNIPDDFVFDPAEPKHDYQKKITHQSLALPGLWRITSFGNLVENPLFPQSDLRIKTHLGQLLGGSASEIEDGQIERRLRTMLLPVGELPLLHLNSILENGCHASSRIGKFAWERKITRALDCRRTNITIFHRNATDENGNPIIPVKEKWKHSVCESSSLFVAFGSTTDKYETIVSAMEIFRFFYATSSILTESLLRGDFLCPDSNLWSIHKSWLSGENHAFIWLRKKMLDADARFLARFAFCEYALTQAQEIAKYAAARGKVNGERIIKALPPFEDNVNCTFLCRQLDIGKPDRVFVTRMLTCDWVPPFSEITISRDNPGYSNSEVIDESAPQDWKPSLTPISNPQQSTEIKLSGKPSSAKHHIPTRILQAETMERFPKLSQIVVGKSPQMETKTSSKKRKKQVVWFPVSENFEGTSVVPGKTSKEFISRAIIAGLENKFSPVSERTNAVDKNVGTTALTDVLSRLNCIDKLQLASVSYLTVLDLTTNVHDTELNVFPREVHGRPRRWLFLDETMEHQRMALLARVATHNGRVRYIIELQRKRPGECSTIVLWNEHEKNIPDGFLTTLLMDCAEAGAAKLSSADFLGIRWARLRHSANTDHNLESRGSHFLRRIFIEAKPIPNSEKSYKK